MDKAKEDGKPFFVWHNTTRMHVFTYLPPKYQAKMNFKTNYNVEEAGMAQMDDSIGQLLQAPRRDGRDRQHDRGFHDRQRRGSVHVAGWRHDAVQGHQRHRLRGRFPCPMHRPLARPHQAGQRRERHFLGPRLVPDLVRCRRQSRHHRSTAERCETRRPRPTRTISTVTTRWTCWKAKGESKRHEIFYFGGPHSGAIRIDDFKYQFFQQPYGWPGEKIDDRHADHREPAPGSVRADAVAPQLGTRTTWAADT